MKKKNLQFCYSQRKENSFITFQSSFSDGSNSIETHKRSKSILKNKSDIRLASDPESERLLSDTGSGVSDISVIPVSLFIFEMSWMF